MKKDSTKVCIDIKTNIYNTLKKDAQKANKSATKYLEDCILKRNNLNRKNIQTINKIIDIINIHNENYKALNSAMSNLNQLTYGTYINSLPTSDEILDVLNLVKECTIENREVVKELLDKLSTIANTNNKIYKRKPLKSNKGENQ